ncbi:hypothetical protein Avbf_09220 [Armadillidium vulgare]|nr:hypothetical protein Avbf_09220 [Armadillidium vulgare]
MRTLWSGSGFGVRSGEGVSASRHRTNMSASSSAKSIESSDSGVYELDDIITENSSPELVERVEREFTPVENIDLTITGKACPRLLSGSQRVRQQEQEIMESLRQEGFISTSKQKSTGGLAFELEMEAKLEKLSSLSHKTSIEDKVEEMRKKKDTKEESAIGKREAHLKELRDKLKAQNQRARQIKLKKTINGPPVPVPFKSKPGASTNDDDDDFY